MSAGAADSRPLTLFSALAVRKALDDGLLDAFTATSGTPVTAVFDPTVPLLRRIDAGEAFDALVAVTGSLGPLAERGLIDPATRTPLARTGIGVAVPPGAPHPDLGSRAALVAALRAARSVAYSRTGASGIYFARLLEELGIAQEVNSRATVIDKGFVAEAVVDGRADLAIQQLSELLFVPEAEIVAPLPQEVQHTTEFAVALSPGASADPRARSLLAHLSGPTAAACYARTRLEAL
ncbi:molybdate ABC transporter substrate-binding protein [Streptomyces sp. NPDC090442]|uniref:molybdate ABC transporter substrate-binding protein n=1 Tax=Streptomyces sp. NPDC090442 TaxID=3365962 RepID=UPI0037F9C1AA